MLFSCDISDDYKTNNSRSENTQRSNENSTDNTLTDNEQIAIDQQYTVLLQGYSDSVPGVLYSVEFELANYDKYKDVIPNQQITVEIDGKSYVGTYHETEYYKYGGYPDYVYYTAEGYMLRVNVDGELTFFRLGKNAGENKLQKEECLEIGKRFMEKLVDISLYEMTVKENQYGYELSFTKYIDGIKTSDSASIIVSYNGELFRYNSDMLGRVEADSNRESIDVEKIKEAVYEKIDEIYAGVKSSYSRIEYKEPELTLTTLKDENLGIVCRLEVDLVNEYGEYELVIGELLTFVIPLQK